ncbi:MAG: sigma-54-dependent transcriptional regulator [Nitrospinota bacterium]
MRKINLIIANDDLALQEKLMGRLDPKEFRITLCTSSDDCLDKAREYGFDVGVIDISDSRMDGVNLFKQIREIRPNFEAVVVSDKQTTEKAVEMVKLGAYDYISKPVDISELELIIHKAYEKKMLLDDNNRLRNRLRLTGGDYRIEGESKVIANLRKLVEKVAHSSTPVLIKGEAGSGKEFTARAIHYQCFSKDAPFIKLDCSGSPAEFAENRLFGRDDGETLSLTDGYGLLEMADGGTLYLANIEALTPSAQVKLYQFLETGEYARAGGNSSVSVRARIIASSRSDMREAVAKKDFREDLYYQLSMITIVVPPLRDRKEDILQLVNKLLVNNVNISRGKTFSPKALNAILKYNWPGNVRELRNVVERAVIISPRQVVQASDIPITVDKNPREHKPRQFMSLKKMEKEHLLYVLNAAGGNISRAARILGVSRPKLYRKIEQYKAGEI